MKNQKVSVTQIPEPPISRFLFADTRLAFLWLLLRLYLAYQWITAGWEKVSSSLWVGPSAGKALTGFLMGALKKTNGGHPDVSGWYATFIQGFAIHHVVLISNLVAFGEVAVGLALFFGL